MVLHLGYWFWFSSGSRFFWNMEMNIQTVGRGSSRCPFSFQRSHFRHQGGKQTCCLCYLTSVSTPNGLLFAHLLTGSYKTYCCSKMQQALGNNKVKLNGYTVIHNMFSQIFQVSIGANLHTCGMILGNTFDWVSHPSRPVSWKTSGV